MDIVLIVGAVEMWTSAAHHSKTPYILTHHKFSPTYSASDKKSIQIQLWIICGYSTKNIPIRRILAKPVFFSTINRKDFPVYPHLRGFIHKIWRVIHRSYPQPLWIN